LQQRRLPARRGESLEVEQLLKRHLIRVGVRVRAKVGVSVRVRVRVSPKQDEQLLKRHLRPLRLEQLGLGLGLGLGLALTRSSTSARCASSKPAVALIARTAART
jgi:hypothetical protein